MKIRKLFRVVHRDFSYFFTGMILIYAVTGILLNHARDWNPYYVIDVKTVDFKLPSDTAKINKELLSNLLMPYGENTIKSYYYTSPTSLKIFVKDGTVTANLSEGNALIERSFQRPVLYQLNFMHRNRPSSWWTWFSDIFAASLIIITITGVFLVKGKNGITRRGAILISAGLILPIVAMFLFF